jgi:CHAD domain-containing protein
VPSAVFGAWARTRLARAARSFSTAVVLDLTDIEQLHDLRLGAKKLRYEIEILACVLPVGVREEAYPILTELQRRLGEINDGAVMRDRLQRLSRSMPANSLDVVLREVDAVLDRSRAELAAWWIPERLARVMREIREAG